MTVAIALWSVSVPPGKKVEVIPHADLRIVNVALGHELADASARTSLTIEYTVPLTNDDDDEDEDEDDESRSSTTVLCSLTPNKIEQAVVDLILEQAESYVFHAVGKNTIYVTGNYIDQHPESNFPFDDESEDEEEDAYDLREVSSDVEMNPDELGSDDDDRFEELPDPPKTLKRDSEAMETPEKAKKAERSDKRMKGEDGKAVPAGGEEKSESGDKKDKKKKKKKEKQAEGQNADKPQAPLEKKDAAAPKVKEIAGGVKIKDAKIGSGPQAKKGNTVSMRYIGKLENGKVFDSNTKGKPFIFHLGKGEVIKGWDEGVTGMQAGGERYITIPPNMGYGNKKMADIPPNSTLIFECKLLEIK